MDTMSPRMSLPELNAAALEQFVYSPVSRSMISHLAWAARNVIRCNPTMMPPPEPQSASGSPPSEHPSPARPVRVDDSVLPSLEEFITQLVVSSNVHVPTLMSTLVYLTRLRSRLQPTYTGLRCSTHRIFLACLIMAAKYLNDSSPKNKHWAAYTVITTYAGPNFGFSCAEVNTMETQLLSILDWDLRISEEDLYRELDPFLSPIRGEIAARHIRKQRRRQQQDEQRRARRAADQLEAEASVTATADTHLFPTPPASRDGSRSRRCVTAPLDRSTSRTSSSRGSSNSPPGLAYSSGSSAASSYASSNASPSRSSSPLSTAELTNPATCDSDAEPLVYNDDTSPPHYSGASYPEGGVDQCALVETPAVKRYRPYLPTSVSYGGVRPLLPYEISAEQMGHLHMHDGGRVKRMRGMLGRVFGSGNQAAMTSR